MKAALPGDLCKLVLTEPTTGRVWDIIVEYDEEFGEWVAFTRDKPETKLVVLLHRRRDEVVLLYDDHVVSINLRTTRKRLDKLPVMLAKL